MKCRTVIDKNREEEVVIYAQKETRVTRDIEEYVRSRCEGLVGYRNGTVVRLHASDVHCFTVEGGKVYALSDQDKLWVKERLYTLEESLGTAFVKINQSCIGNVAKIARFDATLSGALSVTFQNGYRDYVSRRQLKTVKERIGF